MPSTFETRLGAAVRAGWWTLLIGVAFVLFQWVAYLALISSEPAWVLGLVGRDVTWADLQNRWLDAITVLRVCMWVLALFVVWATLWKRASTRRAAAPAEEPSPRRAAAGRPTEQPA